MNNNQIDSRIRIIGVECDLTINQYRLVIDANEKITIISASRLKHPSNDALVISNIKGEKLFYIDFWDNYQNQKEKTI